MKILVAVFAFNEGPKIKQALMRYPRKRNYDLVVFDDGSTDNSIPKFSRRFVVLRSSKNLGIGRAIKKVFDYALGQKYDILVIQAGNNKDNPQEIPKLLAPILTGQADFVQGSRFLPGGHYSNTPLYRIFLTKFVHPLLFSLAVGKQITESTNGFRAFTTKILSDPRIAWRQRWLNRYELEPYLLYKVIKLGYRHLEIPVTKIYPSKKVGYTKMKPISGWWSILKPVFYLWWGIKK